MVPQKSVDLLKRNLQRHFRRAAVSAHRQERHRHALAVCFCRQLQGGAICSGQQLVRFPPTPNRAYCVYHEL